MADRDRYVVVFTYEELSNIPTEKYEGMEGLFRQIHLDEAYNARCFLSVNLGMAIRAMHVPSRFAYSGTIAYDNIIDVSGLLALLERKEWYDNSFDIDLTTDGRPDGPVDERHANFLRAWAKNNDYSIDRRRVRPAPGDEDGELMLKTVRRGSNDQDMENAASERVGDRFRTDWPCPRPGRGSTQLCRHHPVTYIKNQRRGELVELDKRKPPPITSLDKADGVEPRRGKQLLIAPPFKMLVFDNYHPQCRSRRRVDTTGGFFYEIFPYTATQNNSGNPGKVRYRVGCILDTFDLGRKTSSTWVEPDGTIETIINTSLL